MCDVDSECAHMHVVVDIALYAGWHYLTRLSKLSRRCSMEFTSWIWANGGCDRSAGDAYSPRHLIPPLVFPGVRVSLVFTVDYSTYLTGHWFWLRIFPFTWLGVLILTAACFVFLIWTRWFWLLIIMFDRGRTSGVAGRQGMLTPPWHLSPLLMY